MNKRITYLLATLLIAESAISLSAQSFDGQTRTYSAINTNYLRTTSGSTIIKPPTTTGPAIDIPTTTGPAITVKLDKIYATEIADARAKVDFQLHNVELKKIYTEQAASLHIALDSNMALTSITSTGEATNDLIETPGVVTIYDSKNFTFEFTAKNVNPDSIKGNSYFTFKIPGYLLTSEVDLEVKVFIEHDTVSQPIISVDSIDSSGTKMVTLKSDTQHARIRYTLDGSDVTLGSDLYDVQIPIAIKSSDTLKVAAFVGTMPSEQREVGYDELQLKGDSNSSDNTTSDNGNSDSNGGSTSNGSSSSNGDSTSNGSSSSGENSSSDKDNNHSIEIDSTTDTGSSTSTTEDLDQSTSGTTSKPTISNSIPDTVSDTVTALIKQKGRNLTTKATAVQYGLTINNQKVKLENKLLVSKERTLAPLRTIAEALNIPIHYHAASKTAIIKTEDKLIEFPLGYNVAIVNGEMIQIDTSDSSVMSTIQDGRTYLPLRFIAEQLNLNIHFDGGQVHMRSIK